jgi:CDP-diacylglycerol pyrophosphatase
VADLSSEDLRRLARLGAKARLEELRNEEAAIRRAFPELSGGLSGRQATGSRVGRSSKRSRNAMSAAARRAVSKRMKRYWADRRKAKTSEKPAK